MRSSLLLTALLVAAAASPAAFAQPQPQDKGGIPTETQRRLALGESQFPWDLVGLFGLLGFLGLRREHPEDSYHPTPVD